MGEAAAGDVPREFLYIRHHQRAVLFPGAAAYALSVADPQSWTAEEPTLVATFKENHYTPDEFVDALGAPSMDAMLEDISPALLPWANAFMKAKVLSHLPALDAKFAKECGTSPLAKRQWEIQSYAFSYRTQSVDGREVVLSGRVTFPKYIG